MPELPEVEAVRASLEPLIGRRVVRATLRRRDVLVAPGDPQGGFSRATGAHRPKRYTSGMLLAGARISGVLRHGKQLAIAGELDRATPVLAAHLGMTGRFERIGPGLRARATPHAHAQWWLDDGSRLRFVDPRRFGGLWALPGRADLDARWSALGPDPLDAGEAALARDLVRAFAGSGRRVKAALLDQRVVAGVGNIYADESLWGARIAPGRVARSLTSTEASALAEAIVGVLRRAVEAGGSTLRDYADANGEAGGFQHQHAVYGRGGQPCRRCGTRLDRCTLAQRTTVSCPQCQAFKGDTHVG
ncbi:MAG: bifunctional DNA-formamidopyrimidine glycosylase/DNA-(apurinic or apyrimidinic site) lyase [Planctomycetota bacterium]